MPQCIFNYINVPFFCQSEMEDLIKLKHMDVCVKYREVYERGAVYSLTITLTNGAE